MLTFNNYNQRLGREILNTVVALVLVDLTKSSFFSFPFFFSAKETPLKKTETIIKERLTRNPLTHKESSHTRRSNAIENKTM